MAKWAKRLTDTSALVAVVQPDWIRWCQVPQWQEPLGRVYVTPRPVTAVEAAVFTVSPGLMRHLLVGVLADVELPFLMDEWEYDRWCDQIGFAPQGNHWPVEYFDPAVFAGPGDVILSLGAERCKLWAVTAQRPYHYHLA